MGQQWDRVRNQKIPWNKWKWGHNNSKSVGQRECYPKREILSITGLSKEKPQSNFTLKGTWKRTIKPKVSRKKEVIKIRAEINEIESKNMI